MRAMLVSIFEHIPERIFDFQGRAQDAIEVAVGEDAALADADGEAFQAAGESGAVVGLDDEMQMRSLHRVVVEACARQTKTDPPGERNLTHPEPTPGKL